VHESGRAAGLGDQQVAVLGDALGGQGGLVGSGRGEDRTSLAVVLLRAAHMIAVWVPKPTHPVGFGTQTAIMVGQRNRIMGGWQGRGCGRDG